MATKLGLSAATELAKRPLTKTLAGELVPAGGKIDRTGEIGYLPQDPRSGNPDDLARTRILDARGLGQLVIGMSKSMEEMASSGRGRPSVAAMKKYGNLEERLHCAQADTRLRRKPHPSPAIWALPDRILGQPLSTLSGGQGAPRIELARILFSGADTMLLDEPTNHLDADSIVWLRRLSEKASQAA